MNFEKLIQNWHSKKIVPEDYFSNFIFEYLAFIAYLKKVAYFEGSDRVTINQLKDDARFASQYKEIIKADLSLQQTWEYLIVELKSNPITNVTSPRQLEKHWDGAKLGVIVSTEDWKNTVEFWYTVRNNLFHGLKDPESSRDMKMAEYAYKTLSPLVDIFVSQIGERQ